MNQLFKYLTACKWVFVVAIVFLLGCSSVSIDSYKDNTPELDVEAFFNGKLTAHGVVKNRGGEVIRWFNADIVASWDDNGQGTLDEQFVFDDGEKQKRIWTLVPQSQKQYLASANDVVGESLLQSAGNALFLKYTLTIPYKDDTINVKVDDRMYLVNDKMLINESIMTKFGFEVGYVTLVIIKE